MAIEPIVDVGNVAGRGPCFSLFEGFGNEPDSHCNPFPPAHFVPNINGGTHSPPSDRVVSVQDFS